MLSSKLRLDTSLFSLFHPHGGVFTLKFNEAGSNSAARSRQPPQQVERRKPHRAPAHINISARTSLRTGLALVQKKAQSGSASFFSFSPASRFLGIVLEPVGTALRLVATALHGSKLDQNALTSFRNSSAFDIVALDIDVLQLTTSLRLVRLRPMSAVICIKLLASAAVRRKIAGGLQR